MSQQLRFLSPRTFCRLHHRFAFISLPAFPLSVSHARTEVRFQSKFQSNNVVAASSDNVDPQKLQVQLEGVQKMRVGAIKKELDALGVAYGDCFEKDELVRRLATVYITKENRAPVAAADRMLDKAIAHISMRKLKSTVASPKEYLLVPLTIGNQGPFDFLLDTGSSTTLISPFIAHGKLGIPRGSGEMSRGLGGMGERGIETREVLLPPIVLEGYSCKPVKGVIMDLANTGLSPSIAGIMGLNILAQFDVEFDFPNERISFYEAGAAAKGDCNMEGMQKLVMSFGQYSLPGLKVEMGPGNVQSAIIDLGSSLSVTNPVIARAAGAVMGGAVPGLSGVGIGGQKMVFSNARIDVSLCTEQKVGSSKELLLKGVQFAVGNLPAMQAIDCNVILGLNVFSKTSGGSAVDTREVGLSPMKQRLKVGVNGASGTQAVQSSDSSAMELLVGRAAACFVSSLHFKPSFGQESFMQSTTESNNMQKGESVMDWACNRLLDSTVWLLTRRNSMHVAFILTSTLVGERVVDYGINKLWESSNVGPKWPEQSDELLGLIVNFLRTLEEALPQGVPEPWHRP